MKLRKTLAMCSYINNQAYLLSKIESKERVKGFLTSQSAFNDKDKAAFLLTLTTKQLRSKKISNKIV